MEKVVSMFLEMDETGVSELSVFTGLVFIFV